MQTISQKLYARFVTTFAREDGQTMAEYGVVLALISLIVVAAVTALGLAIFGKLNDVTNILGGTKAT
jgi:Flp pilus assembly pilin Flp